jgi:hypothetical protein
MEFKTEKVNYEVTVLVTWSLVKTVDGYKKRTHRRIGIITKAKITLWPPLLPRFSTYNCHV